MEITTIDFLNSSRNGTQLERLSDEFEATSPQRGWINTPQSSYQHYTGVNKGSIQMLRNGGTSKKSLINESSRPNESRFMDSFREKFPK